MSHRNQAYAFLSHHGMAWQEMNTDSLIAAYHIQMDAGLKGTPSSLPMIPTWIDTNTDIPIGEKVIVLDAGGTNLRVCTVEFTDEGRPVIDNFRMYQMPGFDRELSSDEFYETICNYLEPVVSDQAIHSIGFCFSYPSEIIPTKDGRLLYWTKEIKVPSLKGTLIGEGLNLALEARGHNRKKIIILNDTVAVLLAGKAKGERLHASSYMGYILGTGANMAYIECNANIHKIESTDVGEQIINMESGTFDGFFQSDIDHAFDKTTNNPNQCLFEKSTSGAYLGPLALEVLKAAHAEGILSEMPVSSLTTREMAAYLENPHASTTDPENPQPHPLRLLRAQDQEMAYHLLLGLIERAAYYVAVNITAVITHTGAGHSPLAPVCINLDGSTIHKAFRFRTYVESHLYTLLTQQGIAYRLISMDDAPIIGAAIAGLTN